MCQGVSLQQAVCVIRLEVKQKLSLMHSRHKVTVARFEPERINEEV